MQIVNKNSIALSLIYLAIVIITLIPFGRGNISGLEVSFPFFIFAIFFLLVKKNKVYDISFFANLFFTLWAVWVLCGITYSYFTFPGGGLIIRRHISGIFGCWKCICQDV